jgi:hypothetical protein
LRFIEIHHSVYDGGTCRAKITVKVRRTLENRTITGLVSVRTQTVRIAAELGRMSIQ